MFCLVSTFLDSLSCFFFYLSLHLRALPSFPTRRSSDLCGGLGQLFCCGSLEPGEPVHGDHLDPGAEVLAQDRKSTRLNSSHVAISYAVFCLKKKKKPRWYVKMCLIYRRRER